MENDNRERLVKILSAAGIASRRGAGDLIKAGRVTVNGETVFEPGFRVAPSDRVEYDSVPVLAEERKVYIMLNKPRGYVCTNADPHADLKAVDLIRLTPPLRLFSAGRLDKDSEGLILFSNDGDYVARLTHPRHEILKVYQVRVRREFKPAELEQMRRGVLERGELLKVHAVSRCGDCTYLITLNEGKNREIRRLTAALGSPTRRLKRLQIGALRLGGLHVGNWRELTPAEIALTLRSGEQP
ncbi:pseudouridine synthase [Victivallis vadensis]|uniref:pseudouridine synthase n=1 Tax=Victivallis vadensis TaxID=172901 RepID=UPI0023F9A61A|nr:pseudouridine synthase [Victivallis vadensis]